MIFIFPFKKKKEKISTVFWLINVVEFSNVQRLKPAIFRICFMKVELVVFGGGRWEGGGGLWA